MKNKQTKSEQNIQPEKKQAETANLHQIKQQNEEYKNKYIRLAADFENFQKRTITEHNQIKNSSKADMILALLPVINNLNLALKHTPQNIDQSWLEGIDHIKHQLEQILTSEGFYLINNQNETFDLNRHEAISYEPSDLPENSIIEIIEPGLACSNGKIIKPARVRVSKGK